MKRMPCGGWFDERREFSAFKVLDQITQRIQSIEEGQFRAQSDEDAVRCEKLGALEDESTWKFESSFSALGVDAPIGSMSRHPRRIHANKVKGSRVNPSGDVICNNVHPRLCRFRKKLAAELRSLRCSLVDVGCNDCFVSRSEERGDKTRSGPKINRTLSMQRVFPGLIAQQPCVGACIDTVDGNVIGRIEKGENRHRFAVRQHFEGKRESMFLGDGCSSRFKQRCNRLWSAKKARCSRNVDVLAQSEVGQCLILLVIDLKTPEPIDETCVGEVLSELTYGL